MQGMRIQACENKNWTISFVDPRNGKKREVSARVPGNVIGDLVRAEVIADPYFGSEVLQLRKFEYIDWEYSTELIIPDFACDEKIVLVFGGVDTVAEYFLDGELIGQSANMFVEQRLDLTGKVQAGSKHKLTVILRSPINYARKFEIPPQCHTQDFNYESLFVRKARHSYGWDILPRLIGAGLWRDAPFSRELHRR